MNVVAGVLEPAGTPRWPLCDFCGVRAISQTPATLSAQLGCLWSEDRAQKEGGSGEKASRDVMRPMTQSCLLPADPGHMLGVRKVRFQGHVC